MTPEIVERAAYNNALWCDAVCSTHRGAGEFHENMWINRFGVPRDYPDIVTLKGADAASSQTEAISALLRPNPCRGWAVKDSFQSLDLSGYGFTTLFDAQWIGATSESPGARATPQELRWDRVESASALLDWEQSWSRETSMARPPLFMPRLLSDPDIHFVFAVDRDAVVGGGILNRGAGVVGISNVFASVVDLGAIWEGLAHSARSTFPGLPLVAYDHRREELEAAFRVGFSPVGPLRIWSHAPPEPS